MANVAKVMVCGIPAELVNENAVEAALYELDIVPEGGMALEGKVKLLQAHFGTLKNTEIADCDICGQPSDFKLTCCPYCGHTDDEPKAAAADPPEEPAEVVDDGDMPESNEESAAMEEADVARAEAEEKSEGITLDPAKLPPPAEEPAKALVKKPRAKREAARPRPAIALAVVQKAPIEKADVARLDAAIAEIKALDRGFGAASWVLAQKISQLDESQQWKLRVDERGVPKYGNFEKFANVELGMTREYANSMKKIFVRFTQEDFVLLGPSRLRVIIQVPEDEQQEMLDKAKAAEGGKPSLREMMADRDRRRKKAGLKQPGGTRRPKKDEGKVTVASVLGKATMAVLRKPARKDDKPEQVVVPKALAKHLEQAYAYFDLENDVRVWLWIKVREDGSLSIQRDVRRTE
jgi:hypothetical protein